MDRHQAAEQRDHADVEARGIHHLRHSGGTGIEPDRLGNVAVRVRVTVQRRAQQRADDRQIRQVDCANGAVRRAIEVQRKQGGRQQPRPEVALIPQST